MSSCLLYKILGDTNYVYRDICFLKLINICPCQLQVDVDKNELNQKFKINILANKQVTKL